ncbi:MAG: hypothetical protein QOC90_1017, partial [Mycobacterium sp.]|nr:hypothetical protein [Mycobacterium sp.]
YDNRIGPKRKKRNHTTVRKIGKIG